MSMEPHEKAELELESYENLRPHQLHPWRLFSLKIGVTSVAFFALCFTFIGILFQNPYEINNELLIVAGVLGGLGLLVIICGLIYYFIEKGYCCGPRNYPEDLPDNDVELENTIGDNRL